MPVSPGTTAHQQIADAVGDALPSMGQVLNTLRDNLDRIADEHGLDRYEVKAFVRENWGFTFPPDAD